MSDAFLTLRWLVAAHGVEEMQPVEDWDALKRAAEDVEVRVVGDNVRGAGCGRDEPR